MASKGRGLDGLAQIQLELGQILLPFREAYAHDEEVSTDSLSPSRLADQGNIYSLIKLHHKRHPRFELLRFLEQETSAALGQIDSPHHLGGEQGVGLTGLSTGLASVHFGLLRAHLVTTIFPGA